MIALSLTIILLGGCANQPAQMAVGSKNTFDVILHISTDKSLPFQELNAVVKRNGQESTIPCLDAGGNDYDLPGDGIYVCISRGGYAKYINVNILARSVENKELSLFNGLLRSDNLAQNNFGFHLIKGLNNYSLLRTANTVPQNVYSLTDNVWLFITFFWGMLVFLFFGFLCLKKQK